MSLLAVTGQGLDGQQYWGCPNCKPELDALSCRGRQALVAMGKIKSPGMIWRPGNRHRDQTGLPQQPAEVWPNVFIGDLDDCKDMQHLDDLGVGFVIILCPEQLSWRPYDTLAQNLHAKWGIRSMSWCAEDNSYYDFTNKVIFDGALDVMKRELNSATKVLVCCWGGVNRSACLVIGFLVFHLGIPLVTAMHWVTQLRGTVLTNRYFRFLLVKACLSRQAALFTADQPMYHKRKRNGQ